MKGAPQSMDLRPLPRLEEEKTSAPEPSACGFYTVVYGATLMDLLWTPWRFAYVTTTETAVRPGVPASLDAWPGDLGCVFCNLVASVDYAISKGKSVEDAEAAGGLILRGKHCFICLNAFPYTSGHVMVMPYAHLDRLADLPAEAAHELIGLAQRTEQALQRLYRPQGFNFGINLGQAAGAGVAGHLHLHALPRWAGDTNFMTTVGETRILPEDLETTWKRMRAAFAELAG
jgi:ATP adenylyltransferase